MSLKQLIRKIKYQMLSYRKNCFFEHPIRLIKKVTLSQNVSIGKYSYIVSGRIYQDTQIGRYCSVAENVAIGADNHPIDLDSRNL